jgi:hypothetical protein
MSRGKVAVLGRSRSAGHDRNGARGERRRAGGQDEFAKDLAGELGVTQSRVESALRDVAAKQQGEQTRAFAESLAAQLDGVSADHIVEILDEQQRKLAEQIKSGLPPAPETGERPDPEDSPLVAALAEGLGKSKSEIVAALEAAGKAGAPAHRGRMPMGAPPPGMPAPGGMPMPGGAPLPGGPGGVPGPGGPGTTG